MEPNTLRFVRSSTFWNKAENAAAVSRGGALAESPQGKSSARDHGVSRGIIQDHGEA